MHREIIDTLDINISSKNSPKNVPKSPRNPAQERSAQKAALCENEPGNFRRKRAPEARASSALQNEVVDGAKCTRRENKRGGHKTFRRHNVIYVWMKHTGVVCYANGHPGGQLTGRQDKRHGEPVLAPWWMDTSTTHNWNFTGIDR